MSYAWDITVPADTEASAPVIQLLKIHFGIITKVEFKFPAGCHGMVQCRIRRHKIGTIIPLSDADWVTGDDGIVEYRTFIEIDDYPKEVEFIGQSPDTDYQHKVTVRIEMLPKEVASMIPFMTVTQKLVDAFTSFLKYIRAIK